MKKQTKNKHNLKVRLARRLRSSDEKVRNDVQKYKNIFDSKAWVSRKTAIALRVKRSQVKKEIIKL
jgi:hypothetical protein